MKSATKEIIEKWNQEISNQTVLPETIKLKINQHSVHESIRSIVPSETLVMHEPTHTDFFLNGESSGIVENSRILEEWLLHIDYLIEKVETEKNLEVDQSDISTLLLRKSTIYCTLGQIESAKDYAQQSLDLLETSIGYYRLAIAQYCLKEYDIALETLLKANDIDGMNFFIHHALQVVLARIRSRKDRPNIVGGDEDDDGHDFNFD
mmetsp:Transcript_1180/g.1195  ORF Transcript_1180/g.1195 Transcript_1180/m.1195 type:complete len:207 (+) Transcript_1180:18-638(+)